MLARSERKPGSVEDVMTAYAGRIARWNGSFPRREGRVYFSHEGGACVRYNSGGSPSDALCRAATNRLS